MVRDVVFAQRDNIEVFLMFPMHQTCSFSKLKTVIGFTIRHWINNARFPIFQKIFTWALVLLRFISKKPVLPARNKNRLPFFFHARPL